MSEGASASCRLCSPPAGGRGSTVDGRAGGMWFGWSTAVSGLWSGQVGRGLWNDTCLTGGKSGPWPPSTGGEGCGCVRRDLRLR